MREGYKVTDKNQSYHKKQGHTDIRGFSFDNKDELHYSMYRIYNKQVRTYPITMDLVRSRRDPDVPRAYAQRRLKPGVNNESHPHKPSKRGFRNIDRIISRKKEFAEKLKKQKEKKY